MFGDFWGATDIPRHFQRKTAGARFSGLRPGVPSRKRLKGTTTTTSVRPRCLMQDGDIGGHGRPIQLPLVGKFTPNRVGDC